MPHFDAYQSRHEDLLGAIHDASHRIATAITEGFKHMANAEAQALADLSQAISDIGTAVVAEVAALQAAINAQGVNNSPAIEDSVQKLKDLAATLNNSLAPQVATPATPPAPAPDVPAQPTT